MSVSISESYFRSTYLERPVEVHIHGQTVMITSLVSSLWQRKVGQFSESSNQENIFAILFHSYKSSLGVQHLCNVSFSAIKKLCLVLDHDEHGGVFH